jgi:hypothetical protein
MFRFLSGYCVRRTYKDNTKPMKSKGFTGVLGYFLANKFNNSFSSSLRLLRPLSSKSSIISSLSLTDNSSTSISVLLSLVFPLKLAP